MNSWRQDKGQKACAAVFLRTVEEGGEAPIGFDELMEVSRVTIEASEALFRGFSRVSIQTVLTRGDLLSSRSGAAVPGRQRVFRAAGGPLDILGDRPLR